MTAPWWKRLVRDRLAIGLAAGFVALWVAHAIAMATRPDDALEGFRNDVFWPADSYLTVAQPGRALQMFGHLMLTFVGGALLGALLVWLLRLAGRERGRAIAERIGAPVFVVMLIYGFLVLRAIPEVVTVIDADAHELRVTRFRPFAMIPTSRVLAATDVRAIGARVRREWYVGDLLVVTLYASLADHELVRIGQRACPGAESDCLAAADPAIAALAAALGRARGEVQVTADGHIEAVELR